jgi:hypothetical protein
VTGSHPINGMRANESEASQAPRLGALAAIRHIISVTMKLPASKDTIARFGNSITARAF